MKKLKVRNKIASGTRVLALIFAFVASHSMSAAASEVVVICNLTLVEKFSVNPTNDELAQKPQPTSREFVLKFDDVQKRVTYIGGEAIQVKPLPDFQSRFENEIVFLGDSLVTFDGTIMRYSGGLSRLTGKIMLRTTYLRASDGNRDPSRLSEKATGTCTAGPRKF